MRQRGLGYLAGPADQPGVALCGVLLAIQRVVVRVERKRVVHSSGGHPPVIGTPYRSALTSPLGVSSHGCVHQRAPPRQRLISFSLIADRSRLPPPRRRAHPRCSLTQARIHARRRVFAIKRSGVDGVSEVCVCPGCVRPLPIRRPHGRGRHAPLSVGDHRVGGHGPAWGCRCCVSAHFHLPVPIRCSCFG
jgi:hypothetical protein